MFPIPLANTEEDYFADINYSKNIECILPTSEMMITFRANGMRAKKSYFVYAEKMDFKGLIQLRLTEKCDQRRMYITTIDSGSFHDLKQDQSLHVTFAGFIENLVRILQDCQSGKLELNLVQIHPSTEGSVGAAGKNYQLQFVEMRSFKNLIHLCLPCRLAPLNVVLFYMHSILDAVQKKCNAQDQVAQQLQHEIQSQQHRLENLDCENRKLRDTILENTRNLNQRHSEELRQIQENMRKLTDQRQIDSERSRKTIAGLQAQLDKLSMDKAMVLAEKAQEQKRCETLNEEIISFKSRNASLKEQNEKLHNEIVSFKNQERKHEMYLSDTKKQIFDLQEKLSKHDKTKADVIAELEAEKKISQTKRQALEMATKEISKANEIILKQTQELTKLKKTVDWRTEVALQQEKAVKEKEQHLRIRNEEIAYMQQTIESLRDEIPQQLNAMREFAQSLETKYSDQIRALRSKLSPKGKENVKPVATVVRHS